MSDRRTSRMVPLIDTEAIKPLLQEVYLAIYGETIDTLEIEPQVMVECVDDDDYLDHAVIITEGVGNLTSAGNTLPIYIRTSPRSMTFSTIPIYWERIPLKGEVDLAEFIRSFGARLDNNWSLWERRIAKAEAKKAKQAKAKA
jgi:hypothetical protein